MTIREENELKMSAEIQIINDMIELKKRSPEEGLRWKSTKQDLFQMIYILYESGQVTDGYGVPATFCELVKCFCEILHLRVPSNPRQYVKQSLCCKGLRKSPLLLRYRRMYI